ncbi:MAG: phosphonate ABC transporter, permease protein PhnE [Marine Group III euryarchaeote CG-Epi3]|jgi:phosphonate transport system permease protein|uniref:Phosphonate ABC transporter, permease protein PhnE n=1 Tax=Marine Group III euryarchaeote CG-Epi3 TaxID=1888997 RepID=A0A1J5TPT4_9ARCH|nr:MAG: phosphonate ABC transporter, permease protein PhnE [Marine Group III euryarchaeote CG-Epi3]|tara:strand:- start:7073 stop:7969 length:897 start_codon:yes stop_codon:yes gene_type:complete
MNFDMEIFLKRKKYPIFSLLIILTTWFVFVDLVDGDWTSIENSLDNLGVFFYESLWPPNWKVLEARSYPVCDRNWDILCSPAYIGIVETLKIAFVSTGLGFILSLPLSTLASRNLYRDSIALPFRFLLSGMRTLPSLIWAIFFVILIGLGPISGVMAMTFYTIGYLGKLQYETIEGLSKDPLDAAKAMGLSNFEIIMRVVIPESANNLISQLLFMFEYNVRHGSVIGIVGAGGIGYYISTYLKFLQYDKVMALLIVLFFVVVIIDLLSIKARSFFVDDVNYKYPSLFEAILRSKNDES